MICLKVDEGYAYDYLSILIVKHSKGLCSEEEVSVCSEYIGSQVGFRTHDSILESDYFARLVVLNRTTFEAVDDAKADKVKASVVHNFNNERFLAKKKLQSMFFSSSNVTEKKN